eukprot:503747-Amphidinium_carterae.1
MSASTVKQVRSVYEYRASGCTLQSSVAGMYSNMNSEANLLYFFNAVDLYPAGAEGTDNEAGWLDWVAILRFRAVKGVRRTS